MVTTDDIAKYFDWLAPYAGQIVMIILPIYIAIGEVFSGIATGFVGILPTSSLLVAYIIMGVFIVLGIVFGVLSEKEVEDKK